VLGDRLYGTAAFFAALSAHHCWGVVRRNRVLHLHKLRRLRKRRIHGGLLEDWHVMAGSGQLVPRQALRYIRWRRGGTRYELLTNVPPARLSAEEVVDLYPYRWRVERMFFDLKEVLNLNRLYAANPNAVAMQVYAAAIVYNALRVAQSDGAAQIGWAPEQLSPAKFFPKVATATYLYLNRQQWEHEIRARYPHLHLRLLGSPRRWVRTPPSTVQVELRVAHRRQRHFCAARGQWKSFAHVRGGHRFTKLT
jgi:Transposase DDE domain